MVFLSRELLIFLPDAYRILFCFCFLIFCLFLFGCAGSLLLCGLFSSCGTQTSHCGGSCCGAGTLEHRASVFASLGL